MDEDQQQARRRADEEQATQKRAAILGMQYFDSRGQSDSSPLVEGVLSIAQMRSGTIVPIRKSEEGQSNLFGVTTHTPSSLLDGMQADYQQTGTDMQTVLISDAGYREYMLRYDPPKVVVYDDVKIAKTGDSDTITSVSKTLESVRTDDIVDYLIAQADSLAASDIHIECQRDNVRIRLRVDGALHAIATISHDKYRVLLASIATKANISTAATDAQSGHMRQELTRPDGSKRLLNMRIETVPTVYGQDVVVRLFNFDEGLLTIDSLGVSAHDRAELDSVVAHPRGMVLVVGPTGSGKSTTLYSLINALNTPDRKIITLEDPVEYSISGVSQIPVNTDGGDSFADKLRAVLRLDPDILMVGEIRDVDAAKTAIQASITGHLVLSTFHANSAASAFSRMIDLIGINPIFSTAIRLVIGQRLVRRLDDATKIEYEPDEPTKNWVREQLADLPEHIQKPNLDNFKLYKPGTSAELPFGYSGRIVVMEQLVVNTEIQKYLRGEIADVNADAIEASAKQQGMVSLLQAGILKALQGETTLEEINRVI